MYWRSTCTQGVDPGLNFSDASTQVIKTLNIAASCPVRAHPQHRRELVFTHAFSGSHQDAIKRGFAAREARNDQLWDVPICRSTQDLRAATA